MPENSERCPKRTEAVEKPVENKLKKPRLAEKLPKSERLTNLEDRLKGTAWRIENVDTKPTYRPATDLERTKYANLSDKKAEAKGIIRRYDEQGVLYATEILETTDHKVTLELGGETFVSGLPKDVKDYMKSVDKTNGPYMRLSNILVADDGSVDPGGLELRVTDRDYPLTSYTPDLERACKKVIADEHGLTSKTFARLEKTAIQFYQEQTATSLGAPDIEEWEKNKKGEDDEKNRAISQGKQEIERSKIDRILSNWVTLAHNVLGGNSRTFYDSQVGYGIAWNHIDTHEATGVRTAYNLRIQIDISTGVIGKIEFSRLQLRNTLSLADSNSKRSRTADVLPDESERITSIHGGKKLSAEVLWDIHEFVLKTLIPGNSTS